jgi:hypothetical protein
VVQPEIPNNGQVFNLAPGNEPLTSSASMGTWRHLNPPLNALILPPGESGVRLTQTLLLLAGIVLISSPTWSAEPEARSGLSVHGGWWDVGAEFQTAWGVFGGVGVPWIAYTPLLTYSGHEGTVAADVRLGYTTPPSEGLSLQALVLSAWIYQWGDPCSDGCTVHEHKIFNFLSVGLRYQFPCGFLAGAEMPLVALKLAYSKEADETGWHHPDWFPPPISAAFTQAYVGYGWTL